MFKFTVYFTVTLNGERQSQTVKAMNPKIAEGFVRKIHAGKNLHILKIKRNSS